jgi:hypothetical protein
MGAKMPATLLGDLLISSSDEQRSQVEPIDLR